MYKPYLSRQKSGKSVQTTVSAGDKTTLKLVTEQLRASQKVLNKSDQFIPSVVVPVRSVRPRHWLSTNDRSVFRSRDLVLTNHRRVFGGS